MQQYRALPPSRGVMYLIQILLPLFDNDGAHFEAALYTEVRNELSDRFGGLTAYSRAPAEGRWHDQGITTHDDIIVMEVMTDGVDTEFVVRSAVGSTAWLDLIVCHDPVHHSSDFRRTGH